jgi:hypothetical protein
MLLDEQDSDGWTEWERKIDSSCISGVCMCVCVCVCVWVGGCEGLGSPHIPDAFNWQGSVISK